MTREERENAIRCLKLWIEREPQLQTYKTCLEALEQEPMRDATPEERESVDAYIKSISKPTGIEFDEEPSGDAVSREAVDDILCLYSDGNGMIDARGAVRMVRELPSVNPQEPKWIPVSERLPQINEWVLCQCRAGYKVLRLTSYRCYRNDTQEYMDSFVIAWMPLPMPYKDGGE